MTMTETVAAHSNGCIEMTMVNQRQDQGAPPNPSVTRQFAMWALAALGVEARQDVGSRIEFDVPERYRDYFGSAKHVVFAVDGQANQGAATMDDGVEQPVPQATLITQLAECLQTQGTWVYAAPARQPVSVHRLTSAMFAAFQVEHGTVSLAGCTLEDRSIVRFTYRRTVPECASHLVHVYLNPDGSVLDEPAVAALGLDDVVPMRRKLPRLADVQSQQMLALADLQSEYAGAQWELLAKTLVWCKYSSGKLVLSIGGGRAEIPFSGWAKPLADGQIKPPPFVCPVSGVETYRVAATDRGKIVSHDAIIACEQSGQKVVDDQLLTCPVTGRRALEEFFSVCPASGERVLTAAMVPCPVCQQCVSPRVIKHRACVACRSLRSVRKEDPRMARLLDEYPALDGWRRWKMYETSRAYILTAYGFIERLLVVIDKQSLVTYRVAISSRFATGWVDASELQRDEILGSKR